MMVVAVMARYRVMESLVGGAVVPATADKRGVVQGSPTSCLLLIIYVNEVIRLMKGRCQPEQLIEWFHILVVMDDTVLLLSTSRRNMMKKLEILQQFCGVFDMMMNCSKTKFFVTNGQEGDTEPIQMKDLVKEHCINVYLGSPFTCAGSVSSTSSTSTGPLLSGRVCTGPG